MEILTKFGIEGLSLLESTVNFLILTALLTFFLYKPILAMLEKRREMIKKAIDDAKQVEIDRVNMKKEYQDVLHQANTDAKLIVQQANDQSEVVAKRIHEDARLHAESLLERAKHEIAHERETMYSALKGNISIVVKAALNQVLQDSLSVDEQQRILDKAIQEIKL